MNPPTNASPDSALMAELQRILSAYQGAIGMMPENKHRAATAKHRNLSEVLSSYISGAEDLADGDSMKQFIIAAWRLMFAYEQAISFIPADKQAAEIATAEEAFHAVFVNLFKMGGDLKIVAFEGKTYEANRPVQAVNAEDFAEDEELVIMETLEPALLKNGQLLHFARVSLAGAQPPQQQEN